VGRVRRLPCRAARRDVLDRRVDAQARVPPETLPVTTAGLIALARAAVAEEEGGENTGQAQDESIAAFMATRDAHKTADPRLS
jgi:hypothetical protein